MTSSDIRATRAVRDASPALKARMAGVFEVLEALTSGWGQVIVPAMLVVSGDAATTVANILAHGLLLRLSLVAAVIAVAFHIVWTFLFYELFRPVNPSLSLLAACVSLVAIAMQAVSGLFQIAPLVVLQDGGPLKAFTTDQLQSLVLMFFKINTQAFYIYLALFGFWCVLIGYLIFRSAFMPRILGVMEAFAGLCWLTFLWPPLAHYLSPYNQALAALAEVSLMVWLLAKGVNAERWKALAGTA